jgi:hypothetical protein
MHTVNNNNNNNNNNKDNKNKNIRVYRNKLNSHRLGVPLLANSGSLLEAS